MTASLHSRPLFVFLGVLLLLALWLSLALGPVSLPLGETLRAAMRLAGLPFSGEGLEQAELILGQIRLPRTLLGLAVLMKIAKLIDKTTLEALAQHFSD